MHGGSKVANWGENTRVICIEQWVDVEGIMAGRWVRQYIRTLNSSLKGANLLLQTFLVDGISGVIARYQARRVVNL